MMGMLCWGEDGLIDDIICGIIDIAISFWPTSDSRAERLEKMRKKRRRRGLIRWLKKGDRRGPIPNIGLKCVYCDYSLNGLTSDTCPECGEPIDFEVLVR